MLPDLLQKKDALLEEIHSENLNYVTKGKAPAKQNNDIIIVIVNKKEQAHMTPELRWQRPFGHR